MPSSAAAAVSRSPAITAAARQAGDSRAARIARRPFEGFTVGLTAPGSPIAIRRSARRQQRDRCSPDAWDGPLDQVEGVAVGTDSGGRLGGDE